MKLQELIGLAVYEVEHGKRVGEVVDFIVSEEWRIVGIELEGKRLFSPNIKVVLWEDIAAYGEDAVMIRNQQAIRNTEADQIKHTFLLGRGKLKELPVLTNDGALLGRLADVYLDQEMGNTIVGLEISDGFISDLVEGRKWLPYTPEITIGEDVLMVPSLSEEKLEKAIHSVNGR
ncbi:PRC-barrel domain-containing protein [Paenibacillus sediminis]|uniref:Uncharacterized protein YrrD n=1 Tax=Paenibacillus sediminis TaxID=664909 RepID=A0ABS4GY29_9BACL|nr:PRC-barrel domain-containing protein [Paenibacillus sediminis]MBP1935180.1 uncharacterized protein YrrD [Paenibacillus sediminis]